MIPRKGISHGSWNFERINEYIAKLGYRRLILNQDKEPTIVAQVREAQRIAGGIEVVDELAHTGDPQSNGAAEQAVWTVKSKTVSVLTTLESKIGQKGPVASPDCRLGSAVRGGLRQPVCIGLRWTQRYPATQRRRSKATGVMLRRNSDLPHVEAGAESMGCRGRACRTVGERSVGRPVV